MEKTWRHVLDQMIAEQCKAAYEAANKGRKRHVPYPVPECAMAMVEALNKDDEYEGKRLMLVYRTGALSLV